jgi:hypothetical protein
MTRNGKKKNMEISEERKFSHLVWTVRGHGCCEDNGTLDIELNECTGSSAGSVKGTEQLESLKH